MGKKFVGLNGLKYFWNKIKVKIEEAQKTVSDKIAEVENSLTAETTARENADKTLQANIENKVDKVNGKGLSTNDYTTEEKNKLSGLDNYDDTAVKSSITDLQTQITSNKTAIESEEKRATTAENNLSTSISSVSTNLSYHTGNKSNPHGVTKAQVGLGNVVNTGDSATPTSGGITKFTTGGAYTLKQAIDKNTTAIATLNGTGTGSVTKTVSDKIAEVVAGAPESLDTLKEISDWIDTHGDSASAMNTAIQANATAISDEAKARAAADTALQTAINGKAASSHTHDDRYYTETEIDTKLSGKANSSHTHTKSQITDFPTSLKNPNALTINGKTYDGSSAVNAGVQTVANGGTGKTTGKDAANYFLNELTIGNSDPGDDDYFICQYAGGGTTTTTYYRRPVSKLWHYIKGKISSVLGLTATNYGGKASTAGTADKATQDGNGNNIVNTYATIGNTKKWSSVYSSSTYSSGYFLLATYTGVASTGNHDVCFAGVCQIDNVGERYEQRFLVYARGTANTIIFEKFTVQYTGGNTEGQLLYATCSTANNAFTINLYGKITGKYCRFNTCIDYASNGDVSDRIGVNNVSMPNKYSTAISGTEITYQAIGAPTATKATQDASGNVITDTYATKNELESVIVGDISNKMDTANPEGTGSFSLNRYTDEENGIGKHSVSMGDDCGAMGEASVALGYSTFAHNIGSVAEGFATYSRGIGSHAEGKNTNASGDAAHAEGESTTASGATSHAEGASTEATGNYTHAEGYSTHATGMYAHAEGYNCTASKDVAHAEGMYTTADGQTSHTSGYYTQTTNFAEFACGQFNKSTKSDDISARTIFSVGNGNSVTDRFNAFEVKDNGDVYAHKLYIGRYDSEVHEVLHSGNMSFDEATATLTITV